MVQMQPEEDDEEEIQTKLSPSVQLLLQKQEDMEEEPVQTKSLSPEPPVVQKQEETEEEEEPVMTKGISGRTQQTRDDLHTRLSRNRGAGQPLPEADRSFMERRFGSDFSDVSVHTDSSAVQMNRELNAQAFTHGRDIYFGAGRYNPGTSSGKKLLAHELTHVVQQKRGHQNLQRYVTCELREDCSKRVRGEITRSRNNPMTVSSVSGPVRGLLVANFAVGSGSVKRDLSNNNIWANFWGQMLTNTNIRWEIIGFSDCGGDKGTNELLRWERAIAVNNALPQLARNQVDAFRAAPLSECIWSNADEQGRIYNRSVLIRQKSVTYEFPEETITVNPYAACYDATTVIVRKNGRMHSCPAVTGSIGSPTPNGLYCIRGQGVAQRTKWHRGRSKWYLIEPQFSTTRSRMHLHPGSISAGCVTVTNESCFDRLAAILNRPGTVTGVGYDGYPPGNTEGVTNPRRTITCVGWLLVNRSTGACSFMTASP